MARTANMAALTLSFILTFGIGLSPRPMPTACCHWTDDALSGMDLLGIRQICRNKQGKQCPLVHALMLKWLLADTLLRLKAAGFAYNFEHG